MKLNQEQKAELHEWREKKGTTTGKRKSDGNEDGKMSRGDRRKAAIAAAVNKQVQETLMAKEKEKEELRTTDDQMRSYISSLMAPPPPGPPPTNQQLTTNIAAQGTATPATAHENTRVTLQSILRRSRNSGGQ